MSNNNVAIDVQYYFTGKQLLGKSAGGFLNKLYRSLGSYGRKGKL